MPWFLPSLSLMALASAALGLRELAILLLVVMAASVPWTVFGRSPFHGVRFGKAWEGMKRDWRRVMGRLCR